MAVSLQIVAHLAILSEPFLPFSAHKLQRMLHFLFKGWDDAERTVLLPEGHVIGQPELLFEKIEDSVVAAQLQKLEDTKKANQLNAWKPNEVNP